MRMESGAEVKIERIWVGRACRPPQHTSTSEVSTRQRMHLLACSRVCAGVRSWAGTNLARCVVLAGIAAQIPMRKRHGNVETVERFGGVAGGGSTFLTAGRQRLGKSTDAHRRSAGPRRQIAKTSQATLESRSGDEALGTLSRGSRHHPRSPSAFPFPPPPPIRWVDMVRTAIGRASDRASEREQGPLAIICVCGDTYDR